MMSTTMNELVSKQNSETYLRPGEAAQFLRMSHQHLQRLRSAGTGPRYIKLSRKIVLYAETDLCKWVGLAGNAVGNSLLTASREADGRSKDHD